MIEDDQATVGRADTERYIGALDDIGQEARALHAAAQLLKEPRVLYGSAGLARDGLDELDLLLAERPSLAWFIQRDEPDQPLAIDDGHGKEHQEGKSAGILLQRPVHAGLGVVDDGRSPGGDHILGRIRQRLEREAPLQGGRRAARNRDLDLLMLFVPELKDDS